MFQRGTRKSLVAAIGLGAVLATAAATLGQSPNDTWWPGYGNGADNSRYFASRQINRSNVNQGGRQYLLVPAASSAARGATSTTAPLGWIAYALPRR